MGFFSHRVEESDLEPGDHIYTWRTLFAYSHHGIYIGRDKVVHFTQYGSLSSGSSSSCRSSSSFTKANAATCLDFEDCGVVGEHMSGVVMSCLNCFLANGSLYRYQYGVSGVTLVTKIRSGVCTTAKSDPPDNVIHRAMYLLDNNGFGKYDVLENNCEDFALYCKTGLLAVGRQREKGSDGPGGSGQASSVAGSEGPGGSGQASSVAGSKVPGSSGQVSSVAGDPGALLFSLPVKIFASNPYVLGATALGSYTVFRYASDIGVHLDASKVDVEDIAAFHGNVRGKEDLCVDGVGKDEDRPKKG